MMLDRLRLYRLGRPVGLATLALVLAVTLLGPGVALADPARQGGGEVAISYGQTASGTITDQAYGVIYVFQGQAGDVVTITMNRTETTLDPYLGLLDANNNVLAEDDDSGGDRDAQIANFRLPANGTYYIAATRFGVANGASSGGYRLTLTLVSGPSASTTGGQTGGQTGTGGAFGGLPIGGGQGGQTGGTGGTGQTGQTGGTAGTGTGGTGGTAGQDLAFTCTSSDGTSVSVPAATLVTFVDVRPGFTYRVTVLGLDGFDPVIGLESEAGDRLCNDDEARAAGSQVAVPGVGLVEANNLTAQIQFTTSGAIGDIQMRIGGFGGQGGRYVAVFEGMAIAPSTEQDAVTINVSESIVNEELYVYMVSQTTGLDPIMALAGSELVCDDAGVGPCSNVPPFPGGGVAIANGETYIAGQFDAGLGVVPGDTGDRTFLFESYQGRSAGDYAMIVIGAAPGAGGATTTGGQTGGTTTGQADLAYGQSVRGTIDAANWGRAYTFMGNAGDRVTITMEAAPGSTLDPYLGLLDPAQNVIAEDDDSAGGLNAQLATTLPSTGLYVIVATRFNLEQGTSSGDFVLTLTGPTTPTGTGTGTGTTTTGDTDGDPFTLVYGEQAQNTITNQDWGWVYSFNGSAGDQVTITMIAAPGSSLDPYLGLFDANQTLLAEDDDSAGGLNAQITATLPSSGTYFILATRFRGDQGTSSGAFTLSVTSVNASSSNTGQFPINQPGTGTGTGTSTQPTNNNTQVVQDTIDNSTWGRTYPFDGNAGDLVTVRMEAAPGSSLDPYLGILDANNNVLVEDNDSGGGTTAQVSVVLPATGSYTIIATRDGLDKGATSGAYILTFTVEAGVRSGSFTDSDLNADLGDEEK